MGECRAAKLIYLVLTSRLLDRPISAAIKGPSRAGKSYIVAGSTMIFAALFRTSVMVSRYMRRRVTSGAVR